MKTLKTLTLLLIVPLLITAQEIDDNILDNKHYIKRISHFKANPLQEGQTVFFGNSITEAGKWATYFPHQNIANRGISGDNTDGMLARIHEVIAGKPAKLFVMAGINDISLNRDNQIVIRQMKMLLRQIKAGSPETKIYVQSILPICDEKLIHKRLKGKEAIIRDYNTSLKILCDEMDIPYIDVYSQLTESPLTLKAQYTRDGLHLNAEAYAIWVDYIRNLVENTDSLY